ncbi:LA2681 family HEPN domain-containing protein [Tundrisphaera lichenicola]|uniref:LA2681 family HEPN domain-containing protein n=1 Tax=Tundrisphaera lichenicola TaxID=2029860 RepID=UPI003EBC6F51
MTIQPNSRATRGRKRPPKRADPDRRPSGDCERQSKFSEQQQSQKPDKGLKPEIESRENWPLRGLFWMAKDLFNATPGFRDAMEPEAREIDITRNHAEHKYLKVHDDLWPELSAAAEAAGKMPADAAFSIGCGMLVQRTIRLMKLARSALVYMAYAVHVEEGRKQHARGSDDKILTLPIRWMNDADKPGMEARLDQPNTESTA